MKDYDFSVLMSVYIKENPVFLMLALKSIWDDQTLKPSEIVIVKDGPLTDDLKIIISDFKLIAPAIIIDIPTNKGLSNALNVGLKVCNYEYVARMDSDDISLPSRFSVQIEHFKENNEIDILGTWAQEMDNNGILNDVMKRPTNHNDILKLIWSCPFIHPSVMFKKSKLLQVGNYNPKGGKRQDDYELWYRCALNDFKFMNIPKVELLYRFDHQNIKKNDLAVAINRFKVGIKGNLKLKLGIVAYIGILVPLFRALLPSPLDYWFYNFAKKLNPRNK